MSPLHAGVPPLFNESNDDLHSPQTGLYSRELSFMLESEASVPVHPKPMVEGGRVFGEDGGEPAL